jgi:anti-anti-sigma factor
LTELRARELSGDLASAPDDLSSLPGLSVTSDPGQRACRLRLVGRLYADTVSVFTTCMTSWVDRGMTHFVVDLTEVSDLDAAGAAALARATHALRRSGGSLHVLATPQLAAGPLRCSGVEFLVRPIRVARS